MWRSGQCAVVMLIAQARAAAEEVQSHAWDTYANASVHLHNMGDKNTYILTVWFLLVDGGEGCKVLMDGPLQQGQAHQTISRFGASSLTSQRRLIPIKV